MRKFKHNYLSTYLFQMMAFCLFIPPMVFTICGLVNTREDISLIIALMMSIFLTIFMLVLFFLLCNLINLIIWIFAKSLILIDEDGVSYKGEKIRFEEVEHIRFELGHIRKYSGGDPCALLLWKDLNGEAAMEIKRPSFIATCMILKRCPHATKRLFPKALAIGYAVAYPLSVVVYLVATLV